MFLNCTEAFFFVHQEILGGGGGVSNGKSSMETYTSALKAITALSVIKLNKALIFFFFLRHKTKRKWLMTLNP